MTLGMKERQLNSFLVRKVREPQKVTSKNYGRSALIPQVATPPAPPTLPPGKKWDKGSIVYSFSQSTAR